MHNCKICYRNHCIYSHFNKPQQFSVVIFMLKLVKSIFIVHIYFYNAIIYFFTMLALHGFTSEILMKLQYKAESVSIHNIYIFTFVKTLLLKYNYKHPISNSVLYSQKYISKMQINNCCYLWNTIVILWLLLVCLLPPLPNRVLVWILVAPVLLFSY